MLQLTKLNANGVKLNATLTFIVAKSCPYPADILNGYVTGISFIFTYGSKISYQCKNSFQLKGPSERTCSSSARWSGNDGKFA